MLATLANGQPAAAVYRRDSAGVLRADGIVVLSPTPAGVSRVIAFHDPALVALFGFLDTLKCPDAAVAACSTDLHRELTPLAEELPESPGDVLGLERGAPIIPGCALDGAEHDHLADVHAVRLQLLGE
jgi:hypothetical protein